jgi:hypothetical protein
MNGMTTHVRYAPFERRFSYRLAQVLVDIDRLGEAAKSVRFFAHNRFNLLSFHDRDHGERTNQPLRPWAEAQFTRAGVALGGGRIELLCFPRVLGFVFNPLSVFFGYGADGSLRGVIYEVNNTFGDTHAYVAAVDASGPARHEAEKRFHVSPFLDVSGRYKFSLKAPSDTFHLTIENWDRERRLHLATLLGRRVAFNDAWLLRTLVTLPLSTLQVIAGIHWQALNVWVRGARYRERPKPPADPASVARSITGPRP